MKKALIIIIDLQNKYEFIMFALRFERRLD